MRLRKAHMCEHKSSSIQMQCCSISVGRKYILTTAGNRIYILNKRGEMIDQIKFRLSKSAKFEGDSVVITHDNTHTLLASSKSHHTGKLNLADRKITDWVGSCGAALLQFNYPLAVHVHPSDNILVVDSSNHHIQVLNQDLSFSQLLGSGR